jgi:hypothetical protein
MFHPAGPPSPGELDSNAVEDGGRLSFVSSIIVVEDIPRSRRLYEDILHLKVTADFGIYNVGFEGGLSLY